MRIQHHKHFEYCMDLLATHEYWKLGTIKDPGEWHFLAIKTKVCTSFYYLQALAAYKVHKLPYRSQTTYCCFQYHVKGLLDNL